MNNTVKQENILDKYLEEQLANEQKSSKPKKKSNKLKVMIAAFALAVVTFVSCKFSGKTEVKGNNITPSITHVDNTNDNNITPTVTPIVTPTPSVSNKTLSDLGVSLEFPEVVKPQYQNPSTDKIDTNKIVEDNKGTLWVDKEAKEESVNIGKVEIDTKDETLEVKNDGNVYEKEESYEIIDKETGNVISSGTVNENGIPDGYIENPVNGDIIKEGWTDSSTGEHHEEYYIDPNGDIWPSKERYESYLESLKTDGETIETEFIPVEEENTTEEVITKEEDIIVEEPEENITIEEGVVNPDGTYTLYDTTYESKADFEQFLLTPDAYGYYNDMIMSLESIEALTNQKVLTK